MNSKKFERPLTTQIEEDKKEKAWKALFAARGAFKGRLKFKNDKEWHDWRTTVYSKQLEKELVKKHGLKD